ncbi:PREDICTED: transcription termination factor MTERF15, mitochondrial-like [Lupinus angustifolius]|nr:PREDICTED: transcription termination factor MTERF15, mitochondrial-like [Lupinus angustifolius]
MLYFLSKTLSPKLILSQNHPFSWISLRFISTTSKSKDHSFTLSYLINTCGFSPQRAATISNNINFKTREKPDSVIEFLMNHGFSQTNALSVIRSAPSLLQSSDPNKFFLPKIEFFKSKGFSDSDILTLIIKFPTILKRSLENEIVPSFDFFNDMFRSEHKMIKTVMRHSGILYGLNSCIAPNINLLREEGVPESHIVQFVEYYPRSLKASPERFKETVEEVKKLEFNPLKKRFVVAIHVKRCISGSTWERKEGIYRRWGWTDDDFQAAFRLHPFCMSMADSKIEAVMEFLVNKLGFESAVIAQHPVLLTLSLEKRIIPRGSVVLALLSKGLVENLNLSPIFKTVEKVFLDKFVYCHEKKEADELLKLYQAKLALAG